VCVEKALCSVEISSTTGSPTIRSGGSYQSGNLPSLLRILRVVP
jgi:hypothetical protein